MPARLYYVHDPMCSWCWAFAPVFQSLMNGLPPGLEVNRLVGGLAPDTDEPMPGQMRDLPAVHLARDPEACPRHPVQLCFLGPRATPACHVSRLPRGHRRAAAGGCLRSGHDPGHSAGLLSAGPQSFARTPRWLHWPDELGLDVERFARALNAVATQGPVLEEEIARSRAMGADSFPSLVLETNRAVDTAGRRGLPGCAARCSRQSCQHCSPSSRTEHRCSASRSHAAVAAMLSGTVGVSACGGS
jgi:putative protein-disulfide isomerase